MIAFNCEGAVFALFLMNALALAASIAGGICRIEKRRTMNMGDACVGFVFLAFLIFMGVFL